MRIWPGSIANSERRPIGRKPCDDWRSRKEGLPARQDLRIPSVYDRVCQQALVNRLEPIFEKVFDQLWVSQGSQDRRCPGQNLARSGGWKRVDRGCGPERIIWVGIPGTSWSSPVNK